MFQTTTPISNWENVIKLRLWTIKNWLLIRNHTKHNKPHIIDKTMVSCRFFQMNQSTCNGASTLNENEGSWQTNKRLRYSSLMFNVICQPHQHTPQKRLNRSIYHAQDCPVFPRSACSRTSSRCQCRPASAGLRGSVCLFSKQETNKQEPFQ